MKDLIVYQEKDEKNQKKCEKMQKNTENNQKTHFNSKKIKKISLKDAKKSTKKQAPEPKIFKEFFAQKSGVLSVLMIALIVAVVSVFSVFIGGGFNTPAKVHASSNMIRVAQAKLTEMGYYDSLIDGVLSANTKQALTNFQKDQNILETGELNSVTLTALGVSSDEQANSDLYLLAKLIYSEARGEIYTGQVAVGAVVLNRVDDAGFPNTLQGVIYQPWAFTALHDGQFNLEPNATAYQAAQDAISGWDPSYGSLYYYNPTTATSSWIFTRTTVVVIGNHVFAI